MSVCGKEVLLHQFHDILPGSSIARVYQEAEKAFHVILDESHELTEKALQSLTEGENGITVGNSSVFAYETQFFQASWEALQRVRRRKKEKKFRQKRSAIKYMDWQSFLPTVWFLWFRQRSRRKRRMRWY